VRFRAGAAVAAAAVLLGFAAAGEAGAGSVLSAHGIGSVSFDVSKQVALRELDALFGAPAARGINTGCGARYTEVEWHDLVAEFRSGRFTGYRYLIGGWPLTTKGSPRETAFAGIAPKLVTSAGVTLGTALADARRDDGMLKFVGVDRWRARDGLVLRADEGSPPRIVEIQVGTCGDF
jgi:hypothetical protein